MDKEVLLKFLINNYGASLNKKELAKVLKCGLSTIDYYIAKKYNIPEYIKMGAGKNSKIIFPTHKVVEFLENTTKTL